MTVTVSTKGQMVIPSSIRKKYRIKPRSKVEFLDMGNEIVIVPIPNNSFIESRGALRGVNVEDLIKQRRKERHNEHKG